MRGWTLAAGAVLTGCASPAPYATARTVRVGGVTHTVAHEAYVGDAKEVPQYGSSDTAAIAALPTYALRTGLAERVDVGLRAGASGAGVDTKWNFVRSRWLDLAIAPGVQTRVPEFGAAVYLPMLLGLNAGPITLQPMVGVGYRIHTKNHGPSRPEALVGCALDLRLTNRFALHPAWMLIAEPEFERLGASWLHVFGVAFNFGQLPEF